MRLGLIVAVVFISGCSTLEPIRKPSSLARLDPISTLEQLKAALSRSVDGDVLALSNTALIDLTGEPTLEINHSITLRGEDLDSSSGKPHLISRGKPFPMFKVTAPGVVIDGLWVEGMEKDAKKSEIIELNKKGIKGVYQFPVTRGFEVSSKGVEIRNSEIEGFSHAAIFVVEGGSVLVEKNHIHHNQRWGLGYGVSLHQNSDAEIRENRFDFNRHSIAGSGFARQGYEAHHNWFGPNHNDSPLDMHGGKDRGDGTQVAGSRVEIHHNQIEDCGWPIFIHRGIAEDQVVIRDNVIRYSNPEKVIGYYNGVTKANLPAGKFVFENNRVEP